MENSFILVKELIKNYEMGDVTVKALQGVNLAINKGKITIILGPSGCGKSTLLNIIGAIDTATSGEVIFEEKIITTLKEKDLTLFRKQDIGFIFQFFNLIPSLTVLENVEISARLVFSKKEAYKKSIEILELVGLKEKINKFPQQLSGGEQQRVAIARALVKEPKVVLADEPTGNLDSITGQKILDLMVEIAKKQGTTFVIVTHNNLFAKSADMVIYLHDGKVKNLSSIVS